ncbi:aminodeoxychorismate lyase [Serinibacter arcticus]|uniref:Endolytic murein transglycosylase n=1 Tax=Serinibacter arcticus TaxID=1655435 RepID=A0A2U1ZRY8_9MICO|nr:endolytic transglycosylase MltG [Serinibacter arcticus]PWD49754.1 aminodeoxychorismate lyase [Serinibacter arcticus]
MTDLFGDSPSHHDGDERRSRRAPVASAPRPKRRRRSLASFLVMIVILGGLTVLAVRVIPPLFDTGAAPTATMTDFPGPGQGEVVVEIPQGATGAAIGQILQSNGVVATVDAFTSAHTANVNATGIQPGFYKLPLEMRAADAVTALLDPNRRADTRITIPEGWRSDQVYQRLADAFGVTVADVEAAAHDYPALGLEGPPNTNPDALDPMEGWLYPGTYSAAPGQGPGEIVAQAYDRTIAELDALGVAPDDRLRVLTVGSIATREVSEADFGKVSRVIANRMAPENIGNFPTLGMDSTLRYSWDRQNPGVQLPGNEHNTNQDPYNTRLNPGLPPSPIGAVDTAAMAAGVAPEEGPWLYFVTVNLCTQETRFTDSTEEFSVIRAEFQTWYAEWTAAGSVC